MLRNLFRRNVTDDSHSEVTFDKQFYDQFWHEFHNHLIHNESLLKPFAERYNFSGENNQWTYAGIHFGAFEEKPIWLTGWTDVNNGNNGKIAAKLCTRNMNSLFEQLKEDQESIHTHFGDDLDWNKPPRYSVGVYKNSVEFGNTSNHEELFEWLRENLEKLERVFMWKLASYFVDGYTQ